MRNIIFGFLLAFSYFSILPIKIKEFRESTLIYQSTLFFIPFVGFILGLITLFSFLILNHFYELWYASLLSAILYLCLYGFLHLEAIVDVIDGYYASLSKKNIYEIMKEPHVGAIGVIGIILFLIVKIASIIYFLTISEGIFKLIVIFILSRASIIFILFNFKLHPKSYFALSLQNSLNLFFILFTFFFYFSISLFFINIYKLTLLVIASLLCSFLIVKYLNKKFGFINGDILGFNIEILELILINILILL